MLKAYIFDNFNQNIIFFILILAFLETKIHTQNIIYSLHIRKVGVINRRIPVQTTPAEDWSAFSLRNRRRPTTFS